MTIRRRRLALLLGFAAAAAPVAPFAQEPAPAPVKVDVVVTARSGAVPALAANAFTVTVAGEAREVVSAAPALAPDAGRTFFVAIDESSVFRGAEAPLRTVASSVADRLAPGDRLGVVLLPASKPALAPTDDAAAIEGAIAGVTGRRPNDFANFGMGIGEALAIAESDSFALTAVADKECHAPAAAPVAAGSPVVPASRGAGSSRRQCVQTIARNVEVMTARVRAVAHDSYRALLDLVASLRETPGPKTVVVVTAGLGIALDAGVFDELAIRAGLSEVAVHAVLVEPVTGPSTRRLVPASVVSERRSLMRRLTEMSASALGAAYNALGSSIDQPLDRLMTGAVPYRLEVRPGAADRARVAARLAVTVQGSGLSARARPYLVPPTSRPAAATTPEARLGRALGGTVPTGDVLPMEAGGYLAGVPADTATLLIAGEVQVEAAPDGTPAITIGYLLLDSKKQPVVKGPVPPVEPPAAPAGAASPPRTRIAFAGSVDGLAPDTYTLRVAATDGAGRVGLVERELVLRGVKLGDATAGDLLVGRIEADRTVSLAPGAVASGDTVFVQWDLTGVRGPAPAATLKIVDCASGAAVMPLPADVDTTTPGTARVTALVKPGLLPAGDFEVVGEVSADGRTLGERRHGFAVRAAAPAGAPGAAPAAAAGGLATLVGDVSSLVGPFRREDVLGPVLLPTLLAELEPRARSEAGRRALARARARQYAQSEADLAGAEPVVAAFLRGLGISSPRTSTPPIRLPEPWAAPIWSAPPRASATPFAPTPTSCRRPSCSGPATRWAAGTGKPPAPGRRRSSRWRTRVCSSSSSPTRGFGPAMPPGRTTSSPKPSGSGRPTSRSRIGGWWWTSPPAGCSRRSPRWTGWPCSEPRCCSPRCGFCTVRAWPVWLSKIRCATAPVSPAIWPPTWPAADPIGPSPIGGSRP